jgi:preprotein translocase subunit SecF
LPADTSFTTEEVTPTFGASFLSNAIMVGIISVILITIVIFIFFRELVPSLAMTEAILLDMLTAVALTTLFGFSITLSSVAALLMLVGFSIDTDILLTTRALKRQDKTVLQRCNDSVMTGLTVTSTVMGASLVMMIVSYSAQISTIFEIAAIVFFGSIGDIIATYLTNGPILLWYWESKHGKVEA